MYFLNYILTKWSLWLKSLSKTLLNKMRFLTWIFKVKLLILSKFYINIKPLYIPTFTQSTVITVNGAFGQVVLSLVAKDPKVVVGYAITRNHKTADLIAQNNRNLGMIQRQCSVWCRLVRVINRFFSNIPIKWNTV